MALQTHGNTAAEEIIRSQSSVVEQVPTAWQEVKVWSTKSTKVTRYESHESACPMIAT